MNRIVRKEHADVLHLQTAIELEKKKGPRVPKADEHEIRPKDLGQTAGQRAGETDCVRDVRSMSRPPGDRHLFLRSSPEIERVKKDGRRFQTPLFNLVSFASGAPHTRIGIVVGKRLGMAVTRNRAKRRFRELARQVRQQLVQGQDLLVFPRRESLSARPPHLRDLWISALRHEGLLVSRTDLRCDNSVSV